jgi:hypothetical protein
MQRRTQAILLIVFGLLVIVGVIVWLIWPLKKEPTAPVIQPPAYPEGQTQTGILPSEPTPSAPTPADPALLESRRLEDRLRRMAQDFASRAGSYSNADDFAALRDAGLEATPTVRAFFAAEQVRLRAAYPIRSGTWGQTVRGLASKITSPTPIRSQAEVTVQVDAQVVVESGDAAPQTSYRQASITFQRAGTNWVVSRIDWVDAL